VGDGRPVEEWLHHPPRLLDVVLADEPNAPAGDRGVEQDLVRCRLAALLRELPIQCDRVETLGVRRSSLKYQLDTR
jgi:hypothetical protein